VVKYTIDTSFAVKGLVPPRRKKRDEILEKQQKMHKLARSYLDKVRDKHAEMYIPAVALIETALLTTKMTQERQYLFSEKMPLMCSMNMRFWRKLSLLASMQKRVATIPYS
jgi:hypothetical protein